MYSLGRYHLLRQVSLHLLAPQPTYYLFDNWWEKVSLATSGLTRRGLNSLIILGAWTIWNHRNKCVFDGANPSMVEILILAGGTEAMDDCWGERAISFSSPLIGV
jgi:hypothetical protein